MASGRGWTFSMTAVWAAELKRLLQCKHSQSCFLATFGDLFPTQHTDTFVRLLEVESALVQKLETLTSYKNGGFLYTKLKGVTERKGEGQVPSCGLRLYWVITESPPLLPLEKLTGHATWRQLSPASHFFAKDSCQAEGEKKFVWVICKYPYVSMAWNGSSMDCVLDVLCLFVISILTYQLYQKAKGHPKAKLKSNYKSLTEILWSCQCS